MWDRKDFRMPLERFSGMCFIFSIVFVVLRPCDK